MTALDSTGSEDTDLTVLVCSANVGNAEPTHESFGEWVPDDGEILTPLSDTKYPVEDNLYEGASEVRESFLVNEDDGKKEKEKKKKQQFDIIVIGMQEAAFVDKSLKRKNTGEGGIDDTNRTNKGAPPHFADIAANPALLADAATDVGHQIEKEGKKKKNKLFRKVVKANMMVRGLTTSQTYKAPGMKNSHADDKARLSENHAIRNGAYDTRKFLELIEARCPSYSCVTAKLRGEMRLIILAKKDLAKEISNVYIAGENTGIGGVLANKGGIITTFDLRRTRLSFMTCHLEAHEGQNHYINRNKNLAEIFGGAKTDPNYKWHDSTIISHHMFVCGDLNYRIKFGDIANKPARKKGGRMNKLKSRAALSKSMVSKKIRMSSTLSDNDAKALSHKVLEETLEDEEEMEGASSDATSRRRSSNLSSASGGNNLNNSITTNDLCSSIKEDNPDEKSSAENANPANGTHFALAKSLVDAEDWKTLNDGDELAGALEKKECLTGFRTLPCNFPPTFKVARGEGYQYNEKRTPSYTDRILWKSADGMENNVVPFLYEPCPDFITSDHKPIRGGYKVKMNMAPPRNKQQPLSSNRQVHFLVSDIKCTNLPAMDVNGLSDPYILFISYPKLALWDKSWPVTKVIKKTLNPEWQHDMHITLDKDALVDNNGGFSLAGAMLYMTVMDEDFGNGDDVIGTVALNLKELCSELELDGNDRPKKSGSMLNSITSPGPSLKTQKTKITRPVLRNGQEFGMLECTITSAYLEGKEIKTFLKGAQNKVRSKRKKLSVSNMLSSFFSF